MEIDYEDKHVEVSGMDIHLIKAGRGEPLLYLHGAGGNATIQRFQKMLANYFEVWIPEHPGFGYSQKDSPVETTEDMVFFYLDFIREMNLFSFHLMGQSFGGWLAAELAVISGGSNLKSLTLIDAAGIWLPEKPMADMFVIGDRDLSNFLQYDKSSVRSPMTDEQTDMYLQNRYRMAQLAWDPYLHNPTLRKRLYRIQTPTLIVWGENDPLIPLDYAYAWQKGIPGSELAIIPRCGHTPTKERPEAFVDAVLNFQARFNSNIRKQGGISV